MKNRFVDKAEVRDFERRMLNIQQYEGEDGYYDYFTKNLYPNIREITWLRDEKRQKDTGITEHWSYLVNKMWEDDFCDEGSYIFSNRFTDPKKNGDELILQLKTTLTVAKDENYTEKELYGAIDMYMYNAGEWYWIVDETNVDWTDWQRDQLVKYYDEFMEYV